ncbi:MAG: hypothetical protein H6525_05160 [Actinobacteria bacterium]|nr:hypothetical protein [Actinomycetota bacterium]MCB9412220.1 hypothetical protein [Actinomycetota bacterium]
MPSRLSALILATGVALLSSACAASGAGAEASAATSASMSESPATAAASPSGEVSPSAAASAEQPTTTESETPAVELPAGPEAGTDAAVAWEALMGPEGEYAAAASYSAVIDAFGEVQPYVDIRAAEQRHSDALIRQLNRMGVEAPENPYLGRLAAPADLTAAASAWAAGEVLNVQMYDQLLTQTTDPSLVRVLQNLRRASQESHLPLFEAAAANGGTLDPAQMAAVSAG